MTLSLCTVDILVLILQGQRVLLRSGRRLHSGPIQLDWPEQRDRQLPPSFGPYHRQSW